MAERDADRFRQEAEECRKLADRSVSEVDREAWLALAADWIKLAESLQVERGQWFRNKQTR